MSKGIGMQIDGGDGDIAVSGGSLSIGSTLYQNQYVILKAQKGDIKEYPLLGVGIDGITNDTEMAEWKKSIRDEFARDGLTVDSISTAADGAITINAHYE